MSLSEVVVGRAIGLLEEGVSQREVSRRLNIPRTTLRDNIWRYQQTGSCARRPGQGRKRCTSAMDDRFLVNGVLRNRFQTAPQTVARLYNARDVLISERTVRRRLEERNLTSCRPFRAPELLAAHRRARLGFAREYQNWEVPQWSEVLFTDETRVSLRGPDGRQRVYRRPGERFAQCALVETVQCNGGSVMIWGGISTEARTDLVFFDNRPMTAANYITDVLEDHVVPFAPFIGDGFLLYQDNARPHVARCTLDYLNVVGIQRLVAPARSPDLNPIEHIWDILKRRIRGRHILPDSLHELKEAIVDEWNGIPQEQISNVINSMPRRLGEVIRARGANTHY
ncbi:hypothetical protein M8J76_000466 [Diaphorina citri]|nr:hypothetical protein M8J75_009501 [Diaphorina citri]KAI5732461.1 hypothetical protein M8J76_000466 [Diaphorina citri]KAI5739825.1 hypothetical protein M8J77_023845 [Diaphorina citri]